MQLQCVFVSGVMANGDPDLPEQRTILVGLYTHLNPESEVRIASIDSPEFHLIMHSILSLHRISKLKQGPVGRRSGVYSLRLF